MPLPIPPFTWPSLLLVDLVLVQLSGHPATAASMALEGQTVVPGRTLPTRLAAVAPLDALGHTLPTHPATVASRVRDEQMVERVEAQRHVDMRRAIEARKQHQYYPWANQGPDQGHIYTVTGAIKTPEPSRSPPKVIGTLSGQFGAFSQKLASLPARPE